MHTFILRLLYEYINNAQFENTQYGPMSLTNICIRYTNFGEVFMSSRSTLVHTSVRIPNDVVYLAGILRYFQCEM